MKVRALINFKDFELKQDVKIGYEWEVTKERAEVLLKGNASSNNKPFVEVVEEVKEVINHDEVETADIKTVKVEKAVRPKKKVKEE